MTDAQLIKVQTPAPDFTLPTAAGSTVQLSGFRNQHNVIVFFMRAFTCQQCRAFARQLAEATPALQAANTVALIIGQGDRTAAQRTAQVVKADPAQVLYDEHGAVYETYLLDKVFFSLIQQSAAIIIDEQGVVQYAFITANMIKWLGSQAINDVLAALNKVAV